MEINETFESTPDPEEEKAAALRARIDNIAIKVDDNDEAFERFMAEQIELAERIKKAHPDDKHLYKAYHILAGGSYGKGEAPKFDFDGDLSVEKFIERWEEEINK